MYIQVILSRPWFFATRDHRVASARIANDDQGGVVETQSREQYIRALRPRQNFQQGMGGVLCVQGLQCKSSYGVTSPAIFTDTPAPASP